MKTRFYRFDENQVFSARAKLKDIDEGAEVKIHLENPLSNVVNPNAMLEDRDRLTEQLRSHPDKWEELIPKIANLNAQLNFYAQAISWLERYQLKLGRQDDWSVNMQGNYEDARNNTAGAIKRYEQAAGMPGARGAALFNMALVLRRESRWAEALDAVDRAFAREKCTPYKVLRLQILESMGKVNDPPQHADELIDAFGAVAQLNTFELSWLMAAARMADRTDVLEAARARRTKLSSQPVAEQEGRAPIVVNGD